MGNKVRWKSISLKGFGPYGERIQVDLGNGLNVLVAPNETGKSTLVAGLRAVLFGLPNSNKPSEFGTARFRSWQGVEAFEGEVTFTVGERFYRVRRQFASHLVEVMAKKDGRWQEEFLGEHNPRAYKDSGQYEELLQQLIGVASAEVFAGSFYVEQPLPEGEKLSEHVQSLLSGSGGSFGAALDWLENQLSELTRWVRVYGLSRDKNKDRQLEGLQKEIEELKQRLEGSRSTVAELKITSASLAKLDEELKQLGLHLQRKKQLKEAWIEGRQLHQRYLDTMTKQREAADAQISIKELEGIIAKGKRILGEEFAVFLSAPQELGEDLDSLMALENDQKDLQDSLQQLEKQLEEKETKLEVLSRELTGFEAFQNNPRLLADFQHFLSLQQQKEGEIKYLQRASAHILSYWERLQRLHKEQEAVIAKLHSQFPCFLELNDAQKEALEGYALQKLRLEMELRDRESRWAEEKNKRQGEGGKSPNPLMGRLTLMSGVGVALLIAGWSVQGIEGALLGLALGGLLGWGLDYFILKKKGNKIQTFDWEGLETGIREARERLAIFHSTLKEQEKAFGEELPAFFAQFKELKNHQEGLQKQLKDLIKGEFQLERETLDGLAPEEWPDTWRFLANLSELQDIKCNSLGELVGWLGGLTEDCWQGLWEHEKQLTQLAKQIFPYNAATPIAAVEEGTLRYQKLRESIRGFQETAEELRRQQQGMMIKEKKLNRQIEEYRAACQVYLAAGEGDPRRAKERFLAYVQRQQTLREQESQLAGLLAGLQVEDTQELAERIFHFQNEAYVLWRRLEELGIKHPGLPAFGQNKERQALEEEYRQLEAEILVLEEKEEDLKIKERDLSRQEAGLEGKEPLNLAQGELALLELRQKETRLQFETAALGVAYQELKGAIQEYNSSYRERLGSRASHYFQQLTRSGREVMVNEDFTVKVLEGGRERMVNQFSQGTRDQLFFSLRLAIGDLLAEEMHLPFVFDDPFLNYDEKRLEETKELLQTLAEGRQIFFLSHRKELGVWGSPVTMVKE